MVTTVRPATLSDIPALLSMGVDLHQESPRFRRFTPDMAKQAQMLVAALQSPNAVVLVLDDWSGFFIGHLEQQPWFVEPVAAEDILYVIPDLRKSQRGLLLLQAFEAWAREKGVAEIRVGISTELDVESTMTFYEKSGFVGTGVTLRKEI